MVPVAHSGSESVSATSPTRQTYDARGAVQPEAQPHRARGMDQRRLRRGIQQQQQLAVELHRVAEHGTGFVARLHGHRHCAPVRMTRVERHRRRHRIGEPHGLHAPRLSRRERAHLLEQLLQPHRLVAEHLRHGGRLVAAHAKQLGDGANGGDAIAERVREAAHERLAQRGPRLGERACHTALAGGESVRLRCSPSRHAPSTRSARARNPWFNHFHRMRPIVPWVSRSFPPVHGDHDHRTHPECPRARTHARPLGNDCRIARGAVRTSRPSHRRGHEGQRRMEPPRGARRHLRQPPRRLAESSRARSTGWWSG